MLGNKHFLGLMLLAVLFVVSCSSKPIDTEGLEIFANVTRIEPRAMQCTGRQNNINVCLDTGRGMIHKNQYYAINPHILDDSPSTGSYTSYSVCNYYGSCLVMKTLTGSTFAPHRYRHVSEIAIKIWDTMGSCTALNGRSGYRTAVDVYLYEYNFVYSWFFSGTPVLYDRCSA